MMEPSPKLEPAATKKTGPTEIQRPSAITKIPLTQAEEDLRDGPADTEMEVAHHERAALGWAAMAAVAAITWIVMPVGVGILFGTLLAFMVQPLFERLKPRLGAQGSAIATVAGSAVSVLVLVGGLAWLFVSRGSVLTQRLIDSLGPQAEGGGLLVAVGRRTSRLGIDTDELVSRVRGLVGAAASRAEGLAEAIVATTASSLLALFFAMLSLHFILCNWQKVTRRVQESFPLRPDYTAELLAEFRRVGRTTLFGTIVTGLAQGALATIGYAVAGVPEPLFFGAATAVASLIPAVGTMLIWVPVGIVLVATGHTIAGVFELIWGVVFVIGVPDYALRPMLLGGDSKIPSLVTFAALFGGVEALGLKGLIIGPVVMALAMAVLRLYSSEARKRRGAPARPRPTTPPPAPG